MSYKVGFLHTIIRPEEKLLIKELQSRKDVELKMIDVRTLHFNLTKMNFGVDVIFERCINHSRALHALLLFESAGIPCVNTSQVATVCGDKLLTSIALKDNNVPQPEVSVAFTEDTAVRAIEEIGYPVVLKPAIGSWGRLISKVNDRDAAETILEHKTILGTYHHSIFYIQKLGILQMPGDPIADRTGMCQDKGGLRIASGSLPDWSEGWTVRESKMVRVSSP